MSDVLLRPEEFRYGRLRPPSRLSMNSLRSALTAVLAGQNPLAIRAKEDYERAFTRKTEHYNQADASANVRKSVDTTYLGKPSRIEEAIKQAASTGHD